MTYKAGTRTAGDSTARGPLRWERAAVNALRRPGTIAADLYFSRYAVAKEIADAAAITGRTDVAYEFRGVDWSQQPRGEHFKRMYATCSVFCTVMQITLDYGLQKETIASVFRGEHKRGGVHRLNRRTLTRSMRCQVCATQIKKEN
jgi:hypothetical protein